MALGQKELLDLLLGVDKNMEDLKVEVINIFKDTSKRLIIISQPFKVIWVAPNLQDLDILGMVQIS